MMQDTAIDPPWLAQARKLIGTHEGAGTLDNPIILEWAKELGGWYAAFYVHDEIPWCGLFVGVTMQRGLPKILLPSNALGALNWSTWGVPLTTPVLGAILTFRRPGGGHVGYYVGEDALAFHVLGGNQSDQVDITRVDKARLVAIRWPASVPLSTSGRILLSTTGAPLSTNEA